MIAESRKLLIVLGPHRSGTSVATHLLSVSGFAVGNDLLPANEGNRDGYWEDRRIVEIDDTLLGVLERHWADVRPTPPAAASESRVIAAQAQFLNRVRTLFCLDRHVVIKDPRLCRLLPVWRPVLEVAKVDHAAVIVLRDPWGAARSLAVRDKMHMQETLVLWVRYLAEAIRDSRGMQRVFLRYDDLLSSPVATLDHVRGVLGLPVMRPHLHDTVRDLIHPPAKRADAAGETAAANDAATRAAADLAARFWKDLGEDPDSAADTALEVLDSAYGLYSTLLDKSQAKRFQAPSEAENLDAQIAMMRRRVELSRLNVEFAKLKSDLDGA